MPTDIKMPQLGESVTEGTVGRWLKQPGERVEKYEALLEVTTDKVDTEVPAPAAGIVREITVPEGTTVRVGTLLAVLDDDGAHSAERRTESQKPRTDESETQNSELKTQNSFVSPVVARLVAEHNLDIGMISGSGQGRRVTKQDVLRYIEAHKHQPSRLPAGVVASNGGNQALAAVDSRPSATSGPSAESASSSAPAVEPARSTAQSAPSVELELPDDAEIIPLSPMRRSIAEHMLRSRQIAPHVTTVFEVDVSQIVTHRERRKADFERQGVKLTYTAYFVQAAVAGLQAVPMINASYADSGIVLHQRMHVGVAVALEDGLIVPVVRDADEKNLLGLARAVNDLSARARARRLKPDETHGGTFTITNHGVGGSLFATPIINQPQAAILGIGAIQKRAVVISQAGVDAIAIRPMCYLSLTIDHRLLDGATADRFLTAIKAFLEGYAAP